MPSGFWYTKTSKPSKTDWEIMAVSQTDPFRVASAICHSSSKLSINWVLRPFSFAFCNARVESKVLWPSLSKVSGTNKLPEPIRIRNYVELWQLLLSNLIDDLGWSDRWELLLKLPVPSPEDECRAPLTPNPNDDPLTPTGDPGDSWSDPSCPDTWDSWRVGWYHV